MMKVPFPVQLESPCPPVKLHVPVTTPLLRVPVVPVVALEVPVRFPVRVSTFPAGVTEFTVRFRVPVTAPVDAVVKLAFPLSVVLLVVVPKQAPWLKNEMPVISSGPLLVTEKLTVKFSKLACCVPPTS